MLNSNTSNHLIILSAEAKYVIILKTFFLVWLIQFWKKKCKKYKPSWLALLVNHFFINIQPNMGEQEKKR